MLSFMGFISLHTKDDFREMTVIYEAASNVAILERIGISCITGSLIFGR